MAKTKTRPAKSSARRADGKPARRPAKQKPHEHHPRGRVHDDHCCNDDGEKIELDDTERKTIDMVLDSDALRQALESEVSAALTASVRKVCRHYGAPLGAAQAQNVAMVLFGD